MSENANNIPLDDEDILDLTVVAEPGKPAAKADGPPEMGDSDGPVDFGADLDALLDSLGADGTVAAPAAKAATAKPVAAPIADQTPVDHTVDPDEEMAMPEMSDIDSLLAELGAEIPAVAEASASAPEPKAPAPEPKAAAPMAEFDDLLAQAQAAEAAKAKEEAAAMMADMMADQAAPKVSPVPNMVGMEEELAAARPAQDEPLAAVDARAVLTDFEDVPDAVEAAGQAAAQTSPDVAPEDSPESSAESSADVAEDALDLNELDALLDDILATAPEMGSPAAKTSPAPGAAQAAAMAAQAVSSPRMEGVADVIPVPDQAIMPVSEDVSALAERVSRLEEADFAALSERLQRLEESVDVLESEEVSEAMMEGFINAKVDAKLESLFIPDSPVMERICEEVRARLAEGYFNESLEKMAAAAAAKVIREEITALMQENG